MDNTQELRLEVHRLYQLHTGNDLSKIEVPEVEVDTNADLETLVRDGVRNLIALSRSSVAVEPSWIPAAQVVESAERLIVIMEIPGVKQSDVTAEVHDGNLSVSGIKKSESQEGEVVTISEVSRGRFHRSFPLSQSVDTASLNTKMDAGILTLELDKKQQKDQ